MHLFSVSEPETLFMDRVSVDMWCYRIVILFSLCHKAAEMKYDVKMLFISCSLDSCKQCSHTKVNILKVCFSSAVHTLHVVDCGSHIAFPEWMKQKRHQSQDVCSVVKFDMEEKELQCKNKSGLNIPHKLKPLELFVLKRTIWIVVYSVWWPLSMVLWRLGSDNSRNKCTNNKSKENFHIIEYVLFR